MSQVTGCSSITKKYIIYILPAAVILSQKYYLIVGLINKGLNIIILFQSHFSSFVLFIILICSALWKKGYFWPKKTRTERLGRTNYLEGTQ